MIYRLPRFGFLFLIIASCMVDVLSETIDEVASKQLSVVFENDYIRAFTIEIKPSEILLAHDTDQRIIISLSPILLQPINEQARKPIRLGAGKTLWLESKHASAAKNISAIPVRYLVIQPKTQIVDGKVAACQQTTITLVDKPNTRVCQLNALVTPENVINSEQLSLSHHQHNGSHEVRIWLDSKIWLIWFFISDN